MLKKGAVWILVLVGFVGKEVLYSANALPHRVLLDTDMGSDDLLALLYLLKLNKSEIDLQAITINSNTWSHAGHAVNHLYDILYMMGRDDIMVGVGGEGGIFPNGTILPDVGGYLPVIEQGISTVGGCRYRQSIPMGSGGLLDVDTNYGLRRGFLPQGNRKYSPLRQPSVQKVMIDTISKGPTTVFVIGAHTNFALFLMKNHHLKKNVEHIYVMGGGSRGNLFTGYTSNPYAEFNIFGDPFAAYQIFHSGIPITLVPLDATDTIPITEEFVKLFETRQDTYEAKYCYLSLKMAKSCYMWDSFMAGVASSIMRNLPNSNGENEFAEMHFMNLTVITSNEPYGISDGSNPFFDGQATPRFNLQKVGVHSGHVQTGLRDPFCFVVNGEGKCKDGYTKEVSGPEGVRVLVATRAKPNQDPHSKLNREFFKSFLDVLNSPHQTGRFKFTTQFPQYEDIVYKPNIGKKKIGKPVVFDMDMSAGDFVALIYLLKVPVEIINLKGILVSATGWTNSATIDTVYDVLHMMGRDDIPVGRGEVFAMGQPNPSFTAVGDCKYAKAIPHGSGGQLDSDTLFGFARYLPRSPRRYTAEKYVKIGAPTDTDLSELRQPLALEVWQSIAKSMQPGSKISLLTNGPLSNIAQVILSEKNVSSVIEKVYVVGGHINHSSKDRGNVFTLPLNRYAEFNIFLDPYAAKTVLESGLDITLIPLSIQRKVSSFPEMIESLRLKSKTPEGVFARHLLSGLYNLQKNDHRYHHMDIFLGEILGAVILGGGDYLATGTQVKFVNVSATGNTSTDGQIFIDKKHGSSVKIVESVNTSAYYQHFSDLLGNDMQSAKMGSFSEQKRIYTPTHQISREAKLRSQ